MKKQLFLTFFAFAAVLLFAGANAFSANEQTYSGRVVAINPQLHYFILERPQGEKTFLAASGSRYSIDHQPVVLGELQKGDEITVKVMAQNEHPVENAQSHIHSITPKKFKGVIMMVDPRDETITVQGKNTARTFHTDRDSRFFIDGEIKLLGQLEQGERVTVEYDTNG